MVDTPIDQVKDLVSVIVRTKDRPQYLRESLTSIRQQAYRPIEIVVVNDCGTPVSEELLESKQGLRVKLIEIKSNNGRSATANAGLHVAAGAYIAFLDDDDVFYPMHLKRTVEFLSSSPTTGAVYTDVYAATQSADVSIPTGYRTIAHDLRFCRPFDKELLFLDNYLPLNAVVFRRNCLKEVGFFDEQIEVLEDWDFWIRMALEFTFFHLCEVTGEFRVRSDESSSSVRLRALFPFTRAYIHRKYASRTMPMILERMLSNGRSSGLELEGLSVLRERIGKLETTLSDKCTEVQSLTDRLSKYLNSPLINIARRLRCVVLRLPPPDSNHNAGNSSATPS